MDLYSIYPKQFRNIQIPIEKDRCFVLMPFSKKHDELYNIIKDELTANGINCFRDDEIFGTQAFMNKVITEILRSRYVIVVLTDYRPNVLYELGIAHCYKDIQNVLILIESEYLVNNSIQETASDLSHLTYTEYNLDDILMIRTNIKEFLKKNAYTFDFQDFLYEHGIITTITENTNDFILFTKEKFGKNFNRFVNVLLKRNLDFKSKEQVLKMYHEELYNHIDDNGNYIDTMIKVFAELLIACNQHSYCEAYVKDFLCDEMIRQEYIPETSKNNWKIDFAIHLAEQEHFLNTLLPWIINYFKNTKSSAIDLSRYKLESFLINTETRKINEAMCKALRESDFHIREHLADIIGEKKLYIAYSDLCNAIKNENSLYAGKSIIVALGKIGHKTEKDAADIILNWLSNNIDRILLSEQSFIDSILIKSGIAIKQLYPKYSKNFDEKFQKYITDNIN